MFPEDFDAMEVSVFSLSFPERSAVALLLGLSVCRFGRVIQKLLLLST